MNKEKDLTIRLEPELKSKIQEKAKELGLSTSAYVRMITKENCDILTLGYNVEKIAFSDLFPKWDNNDTLEYLEQSQIQAYQKGFNAHKQLVKDKLFTVEQVNNLVNSVLEFISHHEPSEFDEWYQKKLIKLLPKIEWEVTFDEQGKLKLI